MIQQQQNKNSKDTKSNKKHYILQTKSLILQPYKKSFVAEYHSWFDKYPTLLYLTGSEPLSLEEQYQNHKSWLEDPSKYTFLIFTKEDKVMVGDVNLFFSQWIQKNEAEINVMIAREQYRCKGFARQVMEAIQIFAWAVYGRDTLIAKIKSDNQPSIKFFEKIGYNYIGENANYQEKQFRKTQKMTQQQATTIIKQKFGLSEEENIASLYSS